jgi:hypothetical protein
MRFAESGARCVASARLITCASWPVPASRACGKAVEFSGYYTGPLTAPRPKYETGSGYHHEKKMLQPAR